MLNRRSILLGAHSATLSILIASGRQQVVAQESERIHGLSGSYHDFAPRVTIGNMVGSALQSRDYIRLTLGAPTWLLQSFVGALGRAGRRVARAASDYVSYRYDVAQQSIRQATLDISGDVEADRQIAGVLSNAMAQDLRVGEALVSDGSLSLTVFREEMALLRGAIEQLRLEQVRSDSSGGMYGVAEPQMRRSGFSETLELQSEIAALRTQLAQMREYAAELEAFAIRHG